MPGNRKLRLHFPPQRGHDHRLFTELYPEESLFDHNEFLEYSYEFTFRGDPAIVEAVFQEVGFATQHGLLVPDDGSEAHHLLRVAPPTMVSS
jgi:hypothetical protein